MDEHAGGTAPTDAPEHERWVEERLAALTLAQKVSLLSGADSWRTPAIESAGIPAVKVTDGPNGARGDAVSGASAACFPVGTALGATWNPALLEEVGVALAEECRSKSAQVLLAPTVNIQRTPLAGRNFECYSEDPYLTAQLAVSFISGLQGEGVGACIKHFAGNESEFERMSINSVIDERALREVYLLPFEQAVAHARPWSVMGAYNRLNGEYACANRRLLVDILKTEWGFDGLVISDWGAVYDTVDSARGGCDLEMPGPALHFGDRLVAAVEAGEVDATEIDDKARRVLRLVARSGRIQRPDEDPERSDVRPEHRALARRVAAESMVLLTNRPPDGAADAVPVLPLAPDRLRTVAVIGPNAERASIMGGGSSIVRAHHQVHPLAALRERLGPDVSVVHAAGGAIDRYVPEPRSTWFAPLDEGGRGLRVDYFATDDVSAVPQTGGDPFGSRLVRSVSWVWWFPPDGAPAGPWGVRWTGTLVPDATGPWTMGIAAIGRARVLLDGEVVVDNWTAPEPGGLFFGSGSLEVTGAPVLEAGREYDLRVEFQYEPASERDRAAIRFGIRPPEPTDPVADATAVAAAADAAIVIVGTNGDWETEGSDRVDLRLPGRQDELIRSVAAANPRTVVVLNTGSPVEMPWIDQVPATLQAWFGGQELGDALADVLVGDADPGGRLPTTFPVRYEDNPTLLEYPGEFGQVRYVESVFVGHRAYDKRAIEPLFPFGHGLSYARFDLGAPVVTDAASSSSAMAGPDTAAQPATRFTVTVPVTNVGDRPGQTVVQLYVRPARPSVARPPQELKGFAKVALDPGATATATVTLDTRSFAHFDPARRAWVAEAGRYDLAIGTSSRSVVHVVPVTLTDTVVLPA